MVCAVEKGRAQCPPLPSLISESMNSASLTLRAHKNRIAVLAQSFSEWGLKKEFRIYFFPFSCSAYFSG